MTDSTFITEKYGPLENIDSAPDCWLNRPERSMDFIQSLKQASTKAIGQSAGGRDIIAIEYGEKEDVDSKTDNLTSALAAGGMTPTEIFPESFYGSTRRRKPVLALQGAIHGSELSGTAAALNLCNVIETGEDLKGQAWPELQKLALDTRIVIIPWLNPDGTSRFPIDNCYNIPEELYQELTTGILKDGTPLRYPKHKECYPINPEDVAYLGSYFNDHGYNLQYDFTSIERQPETKNWMKYYLEERPDAVLNFHCNQGTMISNPSAFLPVGFQHQVSRIGGAVRQRLVKENLDTDRLSWATLPGLGSEFISQDTAIYHTCGALPILCEMPTGTALRPFTCEQLIDIGLLTIEEILSYAHHDGLRPYELWPKVKRQLGYQ